MKCIYGIQIECDPRIQKTGVCIRCPIWKAHRYGSAYK